MKTRQATYSGVCCDTFGSYYGPASVAQTFEFEFTLRYKISTTQNFGEARIFLEKN